MTYRYKSKGGQQDYIPASIKQPKQKAQLYMPDVVYTQVFVDAFKSTPYIEWLTPTVKEKKVVSGQFQYYKMCVDTTDKGDGQSTKVVIYHMGNVDANKKQIADAKTPVITPITTPTPTTTTTSSTTDSKLDILIALMTKQLEGKK
jgi:hypothetical protein